MPPSPSSPGPALLRQFLKQHRMTATEFCGLHEDLPERSRFSRILRGSAKWYDVSFACAVRDVTAQFGDEIPVDSWKSSDKRKSSRVSTVTVAPPPRTQRKKPPKKGAKPSARPGTTKAHTKLDPAMPPPADAA